MTHNKNKNNLTYSVQGEEIFGEFTSSFETDIHLFEEDIEKFIEYNFRDVEILKALDEKFEYVGLVKNLSHKGKHN